MYSTKFFTLAIRGPRDAGVDISDERAQEIFSTAAQFRGEVINELIHLENKIELLLSRYFLLYESKAECLSLECATRTPAI